MASRCVRRARVSSAAQRRTRDAPPSAPMIQRATALDENIEMAARRAYDAVQQIHFDGAHFRRDIAARAIRRWATGQIA